MTQQIFRTRIKFCGITRLEDALTAVELGVDALGFVFYAGSSRCITPSAAREIIRALPPFVSKVGLFVNAEHTYVTSTVDQAGIDVVQFHGNESAAVCALSPRPYIKAVRMTVHTDFIRITREFARAQCLLVDSFDPSRYGGTGQVFDWSLLPNARSKPIVLAGGLNAENVGQAIAQVQPYAVDVSGGIESAPGIKDAAKMRAFVAEVKRVECEYPAN